MQKTSDINVVATRPLPKPAALLAELPKSDAQAAFITRAREEIHRLIFTDDKRFLLIVGPCSIHDLEAGREYARRLAPLAREVSDRVLVVMRVYFEKPRTTIGWKGLVNDPHLDGSYDIEAGLHIARKLLLDVSHLGLPSATEFLDPVVPQHIADLVSWAAIGARTTESQTHREMASGLSMPVGFKNGTDGSLQIALDAMLSARHPHHFLGIDQDGVAAIVSTKGNLDGHVVLRGGRARTNYDAASIADAGAQLRKANLPPVLMVDCSHANSNKQHARQEEVWQNLISQRVEGCEPLIGVMIESHLHEGNQPMGDLKSLRYGVSVTDACLGWETTERMLLHGAERLRKAHPRAVTAA